MKKAYNSRRKYFVFLGLLYICLFFINVSCGLDVLDAVLEDPFVTNESLPNESSAFDSRTFRFTTTKLDNANDFGKCYVYYKIYNSSRKESEKNQLDSIAADSSRKHNSYSTLINSYSYQPLHFITLNGGQEEELSFENQSQNVSIRLTNYGTDAYSARVIVDDVVIGTPVRYNGKSFDFGRTGDNDEKPVKLPTAEENNSDVKSLTEGDTNTFYVVMYGIFQMPSDSFDKIIYSPIHYLGEVKIDAGAENN